MREGRRSVRDDQDPDRKTSEPDGRRPWFHPRSSALAWLALLVQVVAVCVVAVYTYYAREQAKAMREAIGVSQRQVEALDRPWVKVDAQMIESVVVSERGTQFAYRLTLANAGRSVATNVRGQAEVMIRLPNLESPRAMQVEEEQRTICGQLRAMAATPGAKGEVLFPGESESTEVRVFVSPAQVEGGALSLKEFSGRFFVPLLVGCAVYHLPNSDQLHSTRFAYNVYRKLRDVRWTVFEIGRNAPLSDVYLERLWGGGNDAD